LGLLRFGMGGPKKQTCLNVFSWDLEMRSRSGPVYISSAAGFGDPGGKPTGTKPVCRCGAALQKLPGDIGWWVFGSAVAALSGGVLRLSLERRPNRGLLSGGVVDRGPVPGGWKFSTGGKAGGRHPTRKKKGDAGWDSLFSASEGLGFHPPG